MDWWRIENGKLAEHWDVFHTLITTFYKVDNTVFAVSKIQGRNLLNRIIEIEMIQVY